MLVKCVVKPSTIKGAGNGLFANEFIPKGKMVATKDQFPDLDALDSNESKPKKGKKNKKKGTVVSSGATAAIEDD